MIKEVNKQLVTLYKNHLYISSLYRSLPIIISFFVGLFTIQEVIKLQNTITHQGLFYTLLISLYVGITLMILYFFMMGVMDVGTTLYKLNLAMNGENEKLKAYLEKENE